GKIEHLEAIAIAYRELADARARIRRGVLETARPLPPGRLDAFAATLGKRLGGEVVLESRVGPSLIGGFRLTLGREMVDASVAHGLKELGAALAGVGG
ncbi:F0F1 ATP synthase subunit delta, partial [bacterium]|nr:F0F1 ATP synthase subunit delta [bacterium]